MDKHIAGMAATREAVKYAASATAITKDNVLGEIDKALEKPVSYTHLDVYKRQGLAGASGGDGENGAAICVPAGQRGAGRGAGQAHYGEPGRRGLCAVSYTHLTTGQRTDRR